MPVIKVQAGQTGTLALETPLALIPQQTLTPHFLPAFSHTGAGRMPSFAGETSQGTARHSTTALPSHGAPGFQNNDATHASSHLPRTTTAGVTPLDCSPLISREHSNAALTTTASSCSNLSLQLSRHDRLATHAGLQTCESSTRGLPESERGREVNLCVSSSSRSRLRMSTSPDAMSPDPSWRLVGLQLAGLPEGMDELGQVSC